mmetsp:Transcript_40833/g.71725  ORF Transcript_40833/g.71725 Transcript_40833/m.71725 type:complete len:86 (+) Transcript_40833:186-443(+)
MRDGAASAVHGMVVGDAAAVHSSMDRWAVRNGCGVRVASGTHLIEPAVQRGSRRHMRMGEELERSNGLVGAAGGFGEVAEELCGE